MYGSQQLIELLTKALEGNVMAEKQLLDVLMFNSNKPILEPLYEHWKELPPREEEATYLNVSGLIHCFTLPEPDSAKACQYYDRAIQLNNASAMANRAYMYQHGLGGSVNYSEAIRLYDQAIKLNNAHAMNNRAYMHQLGQGGSINYPEAIRLYDQAIKLNCLEAMFNRAYMHENGQGGSINYPEAFRLYDQAIKLNYASAMSMRAYMHAHGKGGPVNHAEAIRLYDQAISLNDATAMNNRAHMHQWGLGGPVNYAEAIRLYDKAITLNHASAMSERAYMYYYGYGGGIVNITAALNLYLKSYALVEKNSKTRTQTAENLINLAPKLNSYDRFKLHIIIPELPLNPPGVSWVPNFFSKKQEKLKQYFFANLLNFLKAMSNDNDFPIPQLKQQEICTWVIEKPSLLQQVITNNDKAVLELIGNTLSSLALNSHEVERNYDKANTYYAKVPKGCSAYVNAQLQLAQVTYIRAKQQGLTPEQAYQQAKPYLDEALTADKSTNTYKAAVIFQKAIDGDIKNQELVLPGFSFSTK